MSPTEQLRHEIELHLQQQDWSRAHQGLAQLWLQEKKAGTAAYVLSSYGHFREQGLLPTCRLAFLRSMTIEPLIPFLRATALACGADLTTYVGQFNAYAQEILATNSPIYTFRPDIVILALQTRDLTADLWERFAELSESQICIERTRIKEQVIGWIDSFRRQSDAHLIIHSFEKPHPSMGIVDRQMNLSQLATIECLNQDLGNICRQFAGVYVLEYDDLVARHGRVRWHDEGKWLTTRMPFAAESIIPMVNEWMKFIIPICGIGCKALVVDLDNTLWGGVLGEDGSTGIAIGQEYPGSYYRAVQRAILDLYHRGVILAICSKNNYAEAMAVLENHKGMLLRPEHFSSMRINWSDKAQNLRDIASELNIGIDAMAFLDDSPAEREWVRLELPDLKVIDLPENVSGYVEAIRDCPWFERLSLTREDLSRTFLYQQKKLAIARKSSHSVQDFLQSLDQEVTISPVVPEVLARVAQLTQKTNQFNLTTRRYSEQQIQRMALTQDHSIYSVRVTDRFGDNGIVGVLITRRAGETCEIDTLVLSCRVLGRSIETAVLSFLAGESKRAGIRRLRGWFIPTKKNAPVRDLYSLHHFEMLNSQDGASLWQLELSDTVIDCPRWIRLSIVQSHLSPETSRA